MASVRGILNIQSLNELTYENFSSGYDNAVRSTRRRVPGPSGSVATLRRRPGVQRDRGPRTIRVSERRSNAYYTGPLPCLMCRRSRAGRPADSTSQAGHDRPDAETTQPKPPPLRTYCARFWS